MSLNSYNVPLCADQYASSVDQPQVSAEFLDNLEKEISAPLTRESGIDPKELELAVRNTVTNYVGYFKSEAIMEYGLNKLIELRDNYAEQMVAKNPHELMRCREVKSIIDFAEMHIRASLYRKETRFRKLANFVHYRVDYPETDPNWEKWVVVEKGANNEMAISASEVPELKEA